MYSVDQYLTISKCDCGRSYCKFFGAGLGNYGESLGLDDIKSFIEDIKEFIEEAPEALEHLKTLLSTSQE